MGANLSMQTTFHGSGHLLTTKRRCPPPPRPCTPQDCWNRPIASAPGAWIDVMDREDIAGNYKS